MNRILVTGITGQLGESFQKVLGNSFEMQGEKFEVLYLGRKEMDLSKPEVCVETLKKYMPKILIHAAAYTAVDLAESERALATTINTTTTQRLADFCKSNQILFVFYSTDYVFSGLGENEWLETDKTEPQGHYGFTKDQAEKYILSIRDEKFKFLIFRTSWVFYENGKNFVKTMLKLASEREELRVVADQIGSPTYAPHLAKYSLDAIKKLYLAQTQEAKALSGVYHMAGSGFTNWYEFAKKIFEIAQQKKQNLKIKNLIPIKSSEYPTPAKRPLNSRLNQDKLKKNFSIQMPHWQEALEECLTQIFAEKS